MRGLWLWLAWACGGAGAEAPREIAWDREACADCGMLVGEPRYAAQLVTREGEVRVYDDPVCVFRDLAEHAPSVARLWFHGDKEGEWLRFDEVAFTTGATTPMGSGLTPVPRGSPGAISFEEAARRSLAPPDGAPVYAR